MIHAHIDAMSKSIIGFEQGTRASFDARHGGDPLWVFVDSDVIKFRVSTSDFLLHPTQYYFDTVGNLQKRTVQTTTPGQVS